MRTAATKISVGVIMPVYRYEDSDAAEEDLWIDSKDPRLGERIRRVWSFAEKFAPRVPAGVIRLAPNHGQKSRTTALS